MTWPTLHAFINHFPIVLVIIGAIAVLLAAMIQRRTIWMYALSTLTLAGVFVYPAVWTGHHAARVVFKAWYIAPGAIRSHSQSADITLWVVGVTGLIALISLIAFMRASTAIVPAKGFRILVGLGALASLGAVSYTGYLGGKIVVDSPILANPVPPVLPATPQVPDSGVQMTIPATPGTSPQATPPQAQQQAQPQIVPPTQLPTLPKPQSL